MAIATPRRSKITQTKTVTEEAKTGITLIVTPAQALAISVLTGMCEGPRPESASLYTHRIFEALKTQGYHVPGLAQKIFTDTSPIKFKDDSKKTVDDFVQKTFHAKK